MSEDEQIRQLADNVESFIRSNGATTFAELSQEFPDDFSGGDQQAWAPEMNIVFWHGLTKRANAAMRLLFDERRVDPDRTTPLVYGFDGAVLDMPLAKEWRHYKTERWMPMIFKVVKQ